MKPGFILIDLQATTLHSEERELLTHPAVAGVILFARNYESPAQLKNLTQSLYAVRQPLIIAVDQEGGRVQRFVDGFTSLPSLRHWGQAYASNPISASSQMKQLLKQGLLELKESGINFNLTPVLDLGNDVNSVIGERAFDHDPKVVIALAHSYIDTMHEEKLPSIGKHFPGHGSVNADSHHELPLDERSLSEIEQRDLQPFLTLLPKLDAIMPAHIVFKAVDARPASMSRIWLQELLRNRYGFEGIILSDCLSMEAAATIGSFENRAGYALEAGCDLISVCNNREGVIAILDAFERYAHPSKSRIEKFMSKLLVLTTR